MSIKLDQTPAAQPSTATERKVDLNINRLSFGRPQPRNETIPGAPLEAITPGNDLFLSSGRFSPSASHSPQTLAAANGRGLNCDEANRDCREKAKAMWVRTLASDLENA